MIYSNAALHRVANGFRLNGFVTECVNMDVLHDVAFNVYNWMYSLPALILLHADTQPELWDQDYMDDEQQLLGYHGILNEHHPMEMLTPSRARDYYENLKEPDTIEYMWHNTTGFHKTSLYQEHGDPSTWDAYWWPVDQTHCFPAAEWRGEEDESHSEDHDDEEELDEDEEDDGFVSVSVEEDDEYELVSEDVLESESVSVSEEEESLSTSEEEEESVSEEDAKKKSKAQSKIKARAKAEDSARQASR